MIRRSFLASLARGAAGLWLAPDALELLAEPRRRYWPGAEFGAANLVEADIRAFLAAMQRKPRRVPQTLTLSSSAYREFRAMGLL